MHVKPYGDMVFTLKYRALSMGLYIKAIGIQDNQILDLSWNNTNKNGADACQGKLI